MIEFIHLPAAIPLAVAPLAFLFPARAVWLSFAAVIASTAISVGLFVEIADISQLQIGLGGWAESLSIQLSLDSFGAAFLLMSNLVSLGIGWFFVTQRQKEPSPLTQPLWLLLVAGLNGLFISGDLFNLYVTLELISLSAVSLCCLEGRAAQKAAARYLCVGLLGSMLYLFGVALLYLDVGTLNLAQAAQRVESSALAWAAMGLMMSGLLAKVALFPLHFWLPAAHSSASAAVSAALSALVIKSGFFLILLIGWRLFPGAMTQEMAYLLAAFGGAGVLFGSWQALKASRLKLMAAYSTVAQIGYLFMFFPLLVVTQGTELEGAITAAMVLMAVSHGFAKSALFLAVGVVKQRFGHDEIDQLKGMAVRLPISTFAIGMAGVALIGLPPSGAFIAKWHLLSHSLLLEYWPFVGVVVLGTLMNCGYIFRTLEVAFSNPDTIATPYKGVDELPALSLATVATVALGLFSAAMWPLFTGIG